ncbi:MAG TPA: hypothetical protein VHM00_10480 [Caldimonas sp.]|nr:hypothetical protein [Caldimonas sp.]HEX2541495.1 hypothetical protein [Caldimonas sp.]
MLRPLLGGEYHASVSTPWFEYLTREAVLSRCAPALNLDRGELAMRIATELRPQNWQVFFWMGSWYSTIAQSFEKSIALTIVQRKLAELEQRKAAMARAGGHARHRHEAAARAFVIAHWRLERAEYNGNRSAFARDYVPRLKREYDVDVSHKTVSASWLKGI